MVPTTLEQARAAKTAIREAVSNLAEVQGIGLTKGSRGSYEVTVILSEYPRNPDLLPALVENVQVRYQMMVENIHPMDAAIH